MIRTILYSVNFFLFFILLPVNTFSQEIKVDEMGEKIIVYPDGSWRYFEEGDKLEELTPARENDFVEGGDEDEISRVKAIKRAESAQAEVKKAEIKLNNEKINRIMLMAEYDQLKSTKNGDDEDDKEALSNLKIKIQESKIKEKEAKTGLKEAKKYAKLMDKMIYMKKEKRDKLLAKMGIISGENIKKNIAVVKNEDLEKATEIDMEKKIDEENSFKNAEERKGKKKTKLPKRKYAKYNPAKDVIFNPPPHECKLTFNGVDELTKKKRKEVKKELFFFYTDEKLKQFLKEKEYLTCYGNLVLVSGGYRFLVLEFRVASKSAPQSFGGLPNRSLLVIQLINGDNVSLINNKADDGFYDPATETFVYQGQYKISGKQEKMLKEAEIDKVRVVWKTGYEDYEVYELDFFNNQFSCLNSK